MQLLEVVKGVRHKLLTFKSLQNAYHMKQLQGCNPRLVQIHAGILVGSDAFESGIHEARRKMLKC